MTKTFATKLALVLAGFVTGAFGGAIGVQSSTAHAEAPQMLAARGPSRPTTVARIHDVAIECGVYGLPGSPAVVALTSGATGHPVKASLESDIFGGEDAEKCLLTGLAGLPMNNDTLRVVLPVHLPTEDDGAAM